ncbi:glutamine synthetase family protein [Acidihalobacter prosperus]|uniref:Gamma-glutamylputrescine synthetase n=1 Tax=Acidihalobacter prosperus TaxID=160660 RepID=A0A1A6C2Q1_9GAMM|nr:glutamine synthetase family protein [Acidihalobacter prosperus]OBS08841.1 gamma-glutamylputrescine synthetase [Acidihalobacter prosperus]
MSAHDTPHKHPELAAFLQAHPDVVAVDLIVSDVNGILRGKRVSVQSLPKIYADGVNLPGSVFAADITGDTAEETGLGFEIGDADQICHPIPGTLRRTPWHARPTAQLLLTMYDEHGAPYFADPRHRLADMLARFRKDLGLTPVVAVELEFYLIDRARAPDGGPQPPISPVSGEREHKTQVYGIAELDDYGAFLEEVDAACLTQGIPADTAVAEYAPGQYEINLRHQSDPLAACDHAVLLKRVVRSVAQRHGMYATFMAKPYADLPGSGTHIHVSLLDADGHNVFGNGDALGSPLLRHALGGLIETMPESMALCAPNANSFRRFREDTFVPLSPAWAYNNRTTALRIPAGPDHARRLEHRVAGADANPYLLTAMVLAGIHHGLTHRCDPGAPIEGNAYAQLAPALPITWLDALRALDAAAILPGYLGSDFLRVYLANKHTERAKFRHHISSLEYAWYLHTV